MTKRERAVVKAAMRLAKQLGRVEVNSLVNGALVVQAQYPDFKPWNEEDGGGPGLFSRLSAANQLANVLNSFHKLSRAPRKRSGVRGR